MDKNINAVHVGLSGFPFGSAGVNKCLAIYKTLLLSNINILVINNLAVYEKRFSSIINKKGSYDGVAYQYTTPSPYRHKSFLGKRYSNFMGRINEFLLIIDLCFKNKIDIMFFYPNGNFFELIYYRFFSIIFGFPLVSFYDEYRLAFEYDRNTWTTINFNLFDKYFVKFVDGILPISEFLIKNINKRGFKGAYLKTPPLVDFNLFQGMSKNSKEDFFLFAGSLVYKESIDLIIKAFENLDNNTYCLYLIVRGSLEEKNDLEKRIIQSKKKYLIKIFSNLEYKVYLEMLYAAKGVLVPLMNRIQDEARSPQKISEYTATANPIITTNVGEIKYFFKDNYNALIADDFNVKSFSKKMEFIIKYPKRAKEIGMEGYSTGLKYFDTNSYRELLVDFILRLIKRRKNL